MPRGLWSWTHDQSTLNYNHWFAMRTGTIAVFTGVLLIPATLIARMTVTNRVLPHNWTKLPDDELRRVQLRWVVVPVILGICCGFIAGYLIKSAYWPHTTM